MAKKPFSSRVRNAVFILLSFLLTLILFLLSSCTVLEATLFNSEFIFDNMNSSNYFIDKCDEITTSLIDLGYASGLDEKFFDNFVDEVMLSEDTREYLDNYYSGNGAKIDTTDFKQSFNTELDEYIANNGIEDVNGKSRDKLVNKAAQIYRSSLEIPLFSKLSAYFLTVKNAMPFILVGLAVLAGVICLVFFLANKWKHRAVKYICYATSGAFLSLGIVPAYLMISGKISHINLDSRALYNMFVQSANSVCLAVLFISLFFLLVSLGLYFLYRRMYKKVSS
ncbi:hypothetical protein [Ruminococcus sp.]|uniref:hypothetical protein n=1 Tax=Ruminococcus sp. TaxID=41978 RepID=UPI002625F092|nr:hypothetical protein [Ruminococcus sp.]MDD6988871.1 hypothetical protein [Ruminococcus sp.]MDY6201313.1 hypothetical protein [Ruminococcus sp.]